MPVSETYTAGPRPATAAFSAARDELLIDVSRRRTARVAEIAADENRIFDLKNKARLAAESGEGQVSRQHMAAAAALANALPLKRRSLETLDEERDRVVRGNHPALATASSRATLEANRAAQDAHQAALGAFDAALAGSGVVQAARNLVESAKGLQLRPPAMAAAIAQAAQGGAA